MTVKVSNLAKEIGVKSRDVINKAGQLGIQCKAANSSLSDSDALTIKKSIESDRKAELSAQGRPVSKAAAEGILRAAVGKGVKKGDLPPDIAKAHADKLAQKAGESEKATGKGEDDKRLGEKSSVKETEKTKAKKLEDPKKPEEPVKEKSPKKEADLELAQKREPEEANIEDKHEEKKKSSTKEKVVKKEEKTQLTPESRPDEEKTAASDSSVKKKTDKKADNQKSKKAKGRKTASSKEEAKRIAEKKKLGIISDDKRRRGPVIVKTASQIEEEKQERKKAQAERAAKAKEEKAKKKAKKDATRRREKVEAEDRSGPTRRVEFDTPPEHQRQDSRRRKERRRDDREYERRGRKRSKFDNLAQYGEESLQKKTRKKRAKPKIQEPAEIEEPDLEPGTHVINVPITVGGFAEQVACSVSQVIMTLMKMGIVSNINANLDEDVVQILAEELDIKVKIGNVEEDGPEEGIEDFEDKEEDLQPRPPIITVMGHVDHGKTSLLDAIRASNVTAKESGGITQHIGASEVSCQGKKIVFLDTPGHEAFTAMRARGADITDIAVLVVAADDSVKPQTIESISHAKAAGVPVIVAINKMDKPGVNPDRVKQDLSEHGILVEDWGGETIAVPVSAKKREGIDQLLEMILLQAEVLELKANPDRLGLGTVIEARLDKAKGPVATLLVTNGTVKSGMSLVAGTTSGRIRLMTDDQGKSIKEAGPATAVEILGLTEVPAAGDEFHVVKSDKIARDIADQRKEKFREEVLAKTSSSTLEDLFSQIKSGEVKELNLIVKADVRGSVGAITASLEKLSGEEVKVNIIHSGVGTVTESDVTLASTSSAIIIGFNVRPSSTVSKMAEDEDVQIRTYRVIYDIIDDVENAMKGMLDPEYKEVVLGEVEIRELFKVPGVGTIGGAYVTNGKVVRNAEVRVVRDGIVVHEGKISSLKRYKDDAREVAQGYECGIGIEAYNDIKEGDIIECFTMEEVERI